MAYDTNTIDKIIPRFCIKPIQNNFLSEKNGKPHFEDREFVEMIAPGLAKSIPFEEVNDDHIRRWPREYDAFKRGMEPTTEGTPLEEWSAITASTALNLRAHNIKTVEQLAGVSDAVLQDVGIGGRDMRERARNFLETAKGNAPVEALQAALTRAQDETTDLRRQLGELAARLDAQEDKKRGPGRPPKPQPED